jgi:SLT domain-containing protein
MGLMQTIAGTFAAYAGSFASRGIWDPFANIFAGLNYAIHRYGSLVAMMKPGGYANGTNNAAPGYAWVGEHGPELLRFNGGEQVTPAGKIPAGGGASGPGRTIIMQVDGHELTRVVLDDMDNVISGGLTRVGVS